MKVVQVLKDGAMDEVDTKVSDIKKISKDLLKFSKSHGNGTFKELYSWTYEDSCVKCYGWYDGEAGLENKHDLPPGGTSRFLEEDSSTQLLFGDIFLVRCQENALCEFDVSAYGEFYNVMFGGFDDCDTETDSEDRNTTSEDEDYDPLDDANDDDADGAANGDANGAADGAADDGAADDGEGSDTEHTEDFTGILTLAGGDSELEEDDTEY